MSQKFTVLVTNWSKNKLNIWTKPNGTKSLGKPTVVRYLVHDAESDYRVLFPKPGHFKTSVYAWDLQRPLQNQEKIIGFPYHSLEIDTHT